ncbi:unnamed protein product, partial [Allacma fusca]
MFISVEENVRQCSLINFMFTKY